MSDEIRWEAPDWLPDAIFYQIFPDRFCNGDPGNDPPGVSQWGDVPTRQNFFGGDLQGILDKLGYLQGLGVNALYLNPIFQAQTNHRYDTMDYFRVDPVLGDNAMLKNLVAEAHRRGMHVILDGVFNHCGDGFPPFSDVLERGAASPYAGWFTALSYPLHKNPLNYLTCGGCEYLPKLNHDNPEVQALILKVARFWLEESGADGWRLDVPFKISPRFWQKFLRVVKEANPQAYLVGEVWREAAPWIKGDTFDGVTNYRLRDLVLDYVSTQILDGEDFGYELSTLLSAHGDAAYGMLNLLGSHDTPRILTLLKGDVDRLAIALTLLLTLPGAPMIYYGDEVGLLGENDPDCRRCMPWDEALWNRRVVEITKSLLALRRAHPALRHAFPQQLAAFNGMFAFKQEYEDDEVIVILNPREAVRGIDVPTDSSTLHWHEYRRGLKFRAANGKLFFEEIPAVSAVLLVKEY